MLKVSEPFCQTACSSLLLFFSISYHFTIKCIEAYKNSDLFSVPRHLVLKSVKGTKKVISVVHVILILNRFLWEYFLWITVGDIFHCYALFSHCYGRINRNGPKCNALEVQAKLSFFWLDLLNCLRLLQLMFSILNIFRNIRVKEITIPTIKPIVRIKMSYWLLRS